MKFPETPRQSLQPHPRALFRHLGAPLALASLALVAVTAATVWAQSAPETIPAPGGDTVTTAAEGAAHAASPAAQAAGSGSLVPLLFVFMLSTFIGLGVIRRVSRLLHTPLMSLTNAISAIAVVGAILVAGGNHDYPPYIRVMGAVALFASMTNIISGFMITDRMLKMFKSQEGGKHS